MALRSPQVAILACISGAQILNHSCFPNVVLDYIATLASAQRGELVVYYRTLRPGKGGASALGCSTPQLPIFLALSAYPSSFWAVAKGEQLYVSYAVCRESRNQRQLYLQRTTW